MALIYRGRTTVHFASSPGADDEKGAYYSAQLSPTHQTFPTLPLCALYHTDSVWPYPSRISSPVACRHSSITSGLIGSPALKQCLNLGNLNSFTFS